MVNKNEMAKPENPSEPVTEVKKEAEGTKFEDLTAEQRAQYEAYMEANPEPPAPEKKSESGEKILELEALFASCETNYPIAELYQTQTEAEALAHPARKLLKAEIPQILKIYRALEKETDISKEKLAELFKKYKYLNNAVGTLNGGGVDHDR